jgi:ABC-type lipoprotein export system ATPase subunit
VNENRDLIQVNDLEKTYTLGEIQVKALRGLSLTIAYGDFLVITGRNGSGKSTLLHQLGLLDHPDAGEIFFDGQEVTRMPEKRRTELRLRNIGYIFQEFALIPELTALENVMLPAMMIGATGSGRKRAEELLAQVDLESNLDHLPSQLSGGEQQKVAIARALINDPMIIIADEPTANLDSVAAADVISVFQSLNRESDHTIVMVTHEPEETAAGNRVMTIADGLIR